MNVIECTGVSKIYGGTRALDNISFSIKENTITGLIGRNGAGKTTLLKMMAGFTTVPTGELTVFSQNPFNNLMVSANSIFLYEQSNFPLYMNVTEVLETGSCFFENWNAALAQRLVDYFSFSPKQTYNSLSKGMKSTFRMIFGLSSRCPLTLFDEPTSGMDAAVRKDFYRALLKDYIEYPRTMIISSHHLNEIEDILENILLIHKGKAIIHLPVAEMKEWAIGLQGNKQTLAKLIKGEKVFYEKSMGLDGIYMVVENDFSQSELQIFQLNGVEISSIALSDLCIYLTTKTKGGIDDVFRDS